MYEMMIKNYINRITVIDVKNFAVKEGITLEDHEANLLLNYARNYWEVFLKGDPTFILNDLKNKVNPNTYNKILELYTYYKKMI